MEKVMFQKQSFILVAMDSIILLILKLLYVGLIFPYRNFKITVVVPFYL